MFIFIVVITREDLTTVISDPEEKRVRHHWIVTPDLRDTCGLRRK